MVLLLFKGFHITNSCPATCGFPVSGFHLLCVVASQHMVVSVLQRPTYAVASQHMQLLRNLWCFSLIEFPPAILSTQVVFFSPRVSTYQSSKSGFFLLKNFHFLSPCFLQGWFSLRQVFPPTSFLHVVFRKVFPRQGNCLAKPWRQNVVPCSVTGSDPLFPHE